MDTLIAVLFILILGLAVAQFFLMRGAFRRREKPGQASSKDAGTGSDERNAGDSSNSSGYTRSGGTGAEGP